MVTERKPHTRTLSAINSSNQTHPSSLMILQSLPNPLFANLREDLLLKETAQESDTCDILKYQFQGKT